MAVIERSGPAWGLLALAFCVIAVPALAQDASSTRQTGLKLDGDEPIQIESDKLEVQDAESKAIFTGNVNVVQGPTLMKSGRMVVHYSRESDEAETTAGPTGASNIERIEVVDDVYVKSESQVATADKATFDMKSEVLVMTGKEVVLTDGGNVIVGCKLTVQMTTGEAKLDGCPTPGKASGRVKMLLQPGTQDQ
ncbi:LptA/OstA family protein [Mesorhizobium xinjiangense]|uniref:LptA/OstA family protein n=1 Tax=Mesorhizobium xinjiangense TaxID=2678685 RepID=UPI0012ECF7DE|nr:LptA/OstA family protein [Mesorhizobium xinjiangense]